MNTNTYHNILQKYTGRSYERQRLNDNDNVNNIKREATNNEPTVSLTQKELLFKDALGIIDEVNTYYKNNHGENINELMFDKVFNCKTQVISSNASECEKAILQLANNDSKYFNITIFPRGYLKLLAVCAIHELGNNAFTKDIEGKYILNVQKVKECINGHLLRFLNKNHAEHITNLGKLGDAKAEINSSNYLDSIELMIDKSNNSPTGIKLGGKYYRNTYTNTIILKKIVVDKIPVYHDTKNNLKKVIANLNAYYKSDKYTTVLTKLNEITKRYSTSNNQVDNQIQQYAIKAICSSFQNDEIYVEVAKLLQINDVSGLVDFAKQVDMTDVQVVSFIKEMNVKKEEKLQFAKEYGVKCLYQLGKLANLCDIKKDPWKLIHLATEFNMSDPEKINEFNSGCQMEFTELAFFIIGVLKLENINQLKSVIKSVITDERVCYFFNKYITNTNIFSQYNSQYKLSMLKNKLLQLPVNEKNNLSGKYSVPQILSKDYAQQLVTSKNDGTVFFDTQLNKFFWYTNNEVRELQFKSNIKIEAQGDLINNVKNNIEITYEILNIMFKQYSTQLSTPYQLLLPFITTEFMTEADIEVATHVVDVILKHENDELSNQRDNIKNELNKYFNTKYRNSESDGHSSNCAELQNNSKMINPQQFFDTLATEIKEAKKTDYFDKISPNGLNWGTNLCSVTYSINEQGQPKFDKLHPVIQYFISKIYMSKNKIQKFKEEGVEYNDILTSNLTLISLYLEEYKFYKKDPKYANSIYEKIYNQFKILCIEYNNCSRNTIGVDV